MMRSTLAATLAAAAASEEFVRAGKLNLSFSDCGDASTHGKVSDLTPTSISIGEKTTVTGCGTLDEAVSGGSFEIDLHASVISKTYTGDLCSPKVSQLPLGAGSLTWRGLKCPLAAGPMSVPVDVALNFALPRALNGAVSMKITGKSSSGDKLLCMNIATTPAAAEELRHPASMVLAPLYKQAIEDRTSTKAGALQAGNLGMRFDFGDCGDYSTHGKVTEFSVSAHTLSKKVVATGTISVEEAVSGGSFEISTDSPWTRFEYYTGDLCSSKVLPSSFGTVTWTGLKCPIAAGTVSVSVEIGFAWPPALPFVPMQIRGISSSGVRRQLFCMAIRTTLPAEARKEIIV